MFARVIFGATSPQFSLNGTNVQINVNKYESIFMLTILIGVHKVQKKVLNFIKRSKADFQNHVSVWRTNDPELRKLRLPYLLS